CLVFFFLSLSRHPPYLHSFPTRRSSDLVAAALCDGFLQSKGPRRLFEASGGGQETRPPSARQTTSALHDQPVGGQRADFVDAARDRKSTRLNSSHVSISYAVFCLKKKKE